MKNVTLKDGEARAMSLEELRSCQLAILDAFDCFCKEYGLEYQLYSGTLLGAVRHKGFIPWDDDIDLLMPNEDYRRMLKIVNSFNNGGMITGRYRLADASIKGGLPYYQCFGKIYDINTGVLGSSLDPKLHFEEGVFIDIFRLDGMPVDSTERSILLNSARYFNEMAYYSSRKPVRKDFSFRNPTRLFRTLKSYRIAKKQHPSVWANAFSHILDSCPDSRSSKQAFNVMDYLMFGDTAYFEENPFFPTTELTFEGKQCKVPARYDEILTRNYGSYMQFPPEKDRVPSHDQGFYYKS